jgi:hypothetical protein
MRNMNKKLKTRLAVLFKGLMGVTVVCLLLSLTSCELDSYAEPDGIVSGTLRDTKADDGVFWTEQPNGFQIVCTETSWTASETPGGQTFWGKADGTFNNDRVFAATYSIMPRNGAFHSAKAQSVEVKTRKDPSLVFDVIPYCSFHDVVIKQDLPNRSVHITFTLTTNAIVDNPETPDVDETSPVTIQNWRLFASARTPYVGNNSGANDSDVSTGAISLTNSQLGQTITYTKSGFKAGTTYHLRLGARCVETPGGVYNMTKIVKMEF